MTPDIDDILLAICEYMAVVGLNCGLVNSPSGAGYIVFNSQNGEYASIFTNRDGNIAIWRYVPASTKAWPDKDTHTLEQAFDWSDPELFAKLESKLREMLYD